MLLSLSLGNTPVLGFLVPPPFQQALPPLFQAKFVRFSITVERKENCSFRYLDLEIKLNHDGVCQAYSPRSMNGYYSIAVPTKS